MQLQPSEEERHRGRRRRVQTRGHEDRQDVLLLRDRQGERGRWVGGGRGSRHRKLTLKTPI